MAKNTQLLIRVAQEDKDRFSLAAEASGEAVSVWIRQTLRAGAAAVLGGLNHSAIVESSPAPADQASVGVRKEAPLEEIRTEEVSPLDFPEAEMPEL